MKTKLLIILLFAALGSTAQSVSILSNGDKLITETVINKNFDHANMGISVLSGETVSIGYRVGTNLNFKNVCPNIYVTNTIAPVKDIVVYIAPSASLGYQLKKLNLFVEYKYLFNLSKMNSSNYFGIGIRL
jgi:hypothetical protein